MIIEDFRELELFDEESFEQEADTSDKENEMQKEISSKSDFERLLDEMLRKGYEEVKENVRQMRLLIPEDIKPIELPKEKRRIGF